MKEMSRTRDSLFQSSNTLNNTSIWSLIELASLYTVPLSAINGFSRDYDEQWAGMASGSSLSNRIRTAD